MSGKDRTLRRLTDLERTASTARVLNLLGIHRSSGDDESLRESPLFRNRILDRSIILKHRLRPHERSLFRSPPATATKILLPIDGTDLKSGARYLFVGQDDFEEAAAEVFGDDLRSGARDREILSIMERLPSLDPFLLREQLKRHGFEASRAYFRISDADIVRMHDFVREQVMALVSMSSSAGAAGSQAHASRLVEKLLSNSPEADFEPLKATLKLSNKEYLDGVFAWRGFLYYKWVLSDLVGPMREVVGEIAKIQPSGHRDEESTAYLPGARERLRMAISQSVFRVRTMLSVYDRAYAALTEKGRPTAFREFLLSAPDMFANLGEQLGAVQHIVSFWRYRFPSGRMGLVSAPDLMDVFLDFEDSLVFSSDALSSESWVA